MSNSNGKVVVQNGSTGIGLGGLIFVVFLILKLAKVAPFVDWSWWWIFAPLWIPVALVIGVLIIIGIIVLLAAIISAR
jgi:hypothetical protein